jgi:hypothetical protein
MFMFQNNKKIWPDPAATSDLTLPGATPDTTPAAIFDITPASYIGCPGLYLGTNVTSFVQNKWAIIDPEYLSIVVGKHIPSNGERLVHRRGRAGSIQSTPHSLGSPWRRYHS